MPVLQAERERLNESPGSLLCDLPSLRSCLHHQLLFLKAKTAQVLGTSPSHLSGSTRRQREQEERKKISVIFKITSKTALSFPPPLFFKGTSPSRLVPLEQSSVTAKPCLVPVQRHLHLHRRAHHVLPQLFPGSLQLFTQPLTQALVNPTNAHGEQPERCHLGRTRNRGHSLKTQGSSDLQPGFPTAATRQPQGDTAYGGRKFVGPKLFPPAPPLSWG